VELWFLTGEKMKTSWENVRELIRSTPKKVLKKVIKKIDGHTIYSAAHFTNLGLSEEIVAPFCKTNKSDGSDPKYQIFGKDGKLLRELEGVWGLRLLEFIASTFEVYSDKEGRGFRANDLIEKLKKKFSKGKQ
jgi:hypothetical protein